MSAATQCDNCGTTVTNGSDATYDWIHVGWGLAREERAAADYCTTACAVVGIENARDEDAERALSAMEEVEDD